MNLCEEAESLLLYQFSQSSKLKALLRELVEPFRMADDELHKLHHGRYIDEASGPSLDIIGSIVGQPRRNLNDDDYRAWIAVGILLNQSSGTPEDVLAILNILYRQKSNFIMHEHQPNDVVFTLLTLPMAPLKAVFDIVRAASPLCTACHFIKADKEPVFRFDVSVFSSSHLADHFLEDNYE